MYIYRSLTKSIWIHKDLPWYTIPLLLYRFKPLMPKNRIKRIKAIYTYLSARQHNEEYSIPLKGDIVFKVGDSNYKVVNFDERIIYSVINKNTDFLLQGLRRANCSELFEEVLEIDYKNKIVKGVLYNGHHPNLTFTKRDTNIKLSALFSDLVMKSQVKLITLEQYVQTLKKNCLEVLNRNNKVISSSEYTLINEFVERKSNYLLLNYAKEVVPLTLSHGDIKQDNIIELDRYQLIDWEFNDYRSISFDLLKFKLKHSNYKELQFEKCIFYHSILFENFLHNQDLLRDLFSLEDIYLRLVQFETRNFAKKVNHIIKPMSYYEKINYLNP